MITPKDFQNGKVIKMGNELYSIVHFQHIKPGKGGAFIRTKLKSVRRGTVIDKTFREIDTVEEIFVEQKSLQYLYREGDIFHFMDNKDYEQITVDKNHLAESVPYLKESVNVTAQLNDGEIISVTLPIFVDLKVVETEPGFKGNTAKNTYKAAKLETGASFQVPLFINTGEVIKIDTRSGKYVGRA